LLTNYYFKIYAMTLVIFMAIDLTWLSLMAPTFYLAQVGHLMAATTNWIAAVLFYLEIVAGLLVFVIIPGLSATSFRQPLARATLYGLVTYGTYELSNLATLREWSPSLTMVDTSWGICVSTAVSFISLRFARRLATRAPHAVR
jgi:uncharacterized membrane protein